MLNIFNYKRKIIEFTPEQNAELRKSLIENYFSSCTQEYLISSDGQDDIENHLINRLKNFRDKTIPWLDDSLRLKKKKILEIGSGTGSSTLALSEAGANVTGIDIKYSDLIVAKKRLELAGLDAKLLEGNADNLIELFPNQTFDAIIYFATLEHMTNEERLTSLAQAWKLLEKGGYLIVIEAPNRLWFYDDHTSLLPFYYWLPNDLAFAYTKMSDRKSLNERYRKNTPEEMTHFLRRGRGVSYHEFDLAIGQNLKIKSYLNDFNAKNYPLTEIEKDYSDFLSRVGPKGINQGWYQRYIDIIIQK